MPAKKRGRPKKPATATKIVQSKTHELSAARRQVISILLFAVAIFLMCVVLIEGQNAWLALHNFMFGVFGLCAYIWPLFLGLVAVLCALDRLYGSVCTKIIEASVFVVLVGAAIDIFSVHAETETFFAYLSDAYTTGMTVKGGGFLGALFGHPLYLLFGKTGAGVTICLLLFVFAMLITGTTLVAFFRAVVRPVQKMERHAEAVYEDRQERKVARRQQKEAELVSVPKLDIDIPVDDIPEERPVVAEDLSDKQRRVVEAYRGVETEATVELEPSKPAEGESQGVEEALKVASAEKKGKAKPAEEPATNYVPGSGIVITEGDGYRYPPLSLLKEPTHPAGELTSSELDHTGTKLVEILRSFGVETKIVDISRGPTVTRYELQPSAGVKISRITGLADDIALNLATAGVRIEAPIPNKAAVGIEVPNKHNNIVCVREILESPAFIGAKSKLTIALGRDIGGNAVVTDIAKMPHGLIAGATGSGKSVCINSIIISLLYKATPDEVKLLMIDPKVVELGVYNGIPHLLVPVVTDPRKAAGALGWAVTEMERRYQLFAEHNVRDLVGYNRLAARGDGMIAMPQIVIIIDELADLMMTAPNEVEDSICRIAQKARAAGMHLIIATQRPSVDVVTGLIKANVPTRIAFAVSSQVDSRTILDVGGAEKLLGRGDMLFSPLGATKSSRVQGCFVSDDEVEAVVEYIKGDHTSDYDEEVMHEIERQAAIEKKAKSGLPEDGPDDDPMLNQAIEVVVDAGQASTSLLQRRLKLGYARAARLIDEMETRGVVGPYEGSKPRQVLLTKAQLLERQASEES